MAAGAQVRATAATRVLDGLAAAHSTSDLDLALEELKIVDALFGWTPVRMRAPASVVIPPLTPVTPELEQVPPANERPRSQPDVPGLRRRLIQSLDLAAQYAGGEKLDGPVAQAVRRFQARHHGLVPDGVVGFKTAALLNESVTGQIGRVELNMARNLAANIISGRAGFRRYVEVNVPGFELRVVEGGRVVLRSRVIVGGKDNPTPIFDNWIRYIEINPSWYVPRSIQTELLEKEQQRPGYLDQNGFYWRGHRRRRPAGAAPRARRTRSAGSSSCSLTGTPSTCTTRRSARPVRPQPAQPQPRLYPRREAATSWRRPCSGRTAGMPGGSTARSPAPRPGASTSASRYRCSSTTAPPSSTTRADCCYGLTCTATTRRASRAFR